MVAVGSGPRGWRWKIDGGHDPLITELEGSFFFRQRDRLSAGRQRATVERGGISFCFFSFFLRLLAGWVGWIRSCLMWGCVW